MLTSEGDFIAVGHWQIGSIAVRVLDFEDKAVDGAYWEDRLRVAYDLRCAIGVAGHEKGNDTYRLVHGEGDCLPGLVVDVYGKTAVMQAHSVGMHVARHEIARALVAVTGGTVENVYYKSETTLPFKAELGQENGFIVGGSTENVAVENGLKFHIDWLKGQKTGFFVDQRDNRSLLEHYAHGRAVLNMFCYTGGFSVYAHAWRSHVGAFRGQFGQGDRPDPRQRGTELSGRCRHEAYAEDAFKYLDAMGDQYDLIILDPPAFAKHKDALRQALKGYARLNAKAFSKIKPGGIPVHVQLFAGGKQGPFPYRCFYRRCAERTSRAYPSPVASTGRPSRQYLPPRRGIFEGVGTLCGVKNKGQMKNKVKYHTFFCA